MNVLVIGSGAREHALARAVSHSPRCGTVSVYPGNAGTSAEFSSFAPAGDDPASIADRAVHDAIDLAIIGPESFLAAGLADALRLKGLATLGPGARAARLETSKSHAKAFMSRHGIPTAAFEVFNDFGTARSHVERTGRPWVVKADGIAAGKGVIVASSVEQTVHALEECFIHKTFGTAGASVVLEEHLSGPEISFHVLTDGDHWVALGAAQDHKRLLHHDAGPNTGGMGAYAPLPWLTPTLHEKILHTIVEPTMKGLRDESLGFRGVLFFGIMVHNHQPHLLEYNTRFGDPECSVLLTDPQFDYLQCFYDTATGVLDPTRPSHVPVPAVSIVLASEGYPQQPLLGVPIHGLDEASGIAQATVFHAGTRTVNEAVVTSGGRVLVARGTGADLRTARANALDAVSRIHFQGMQYRRDIGAQAITD